jgi:hypothetical protein
LFYDAAMPDKSLAPRAQSAISFRIGRWAQASATGWGVAALVVLAAMLLATVVLGAGPTLLPH